MRKVFLWSQTNPWIVIIGVTIISLLALFSARNIRIDASTEGMMIEEDPAQDYYRNTLKKFGTDNITVIFIQDKNLFTPEKLKLLDNLVFKFEEVPGVSKVESLYSVTNFKGVDGALETNPLMDWPPETQEEAEQIKKDALRSPILLNSLISKDGYATAINLFVNVDSNDPEFNVKFSRQVDEIIRPFEHQYDTIFQIGLSYTRRLITENILGDTIKLVPLAAFVLLLTLVLSMRSASGALLPMLTAGVSIIWTAGFMALVSIPLNVLTVIVPALIIVIGSTEDIHILSEYLEGIEETRGDRDEAIKIMSGKVGTAVLLTSLTTFIGFLSITLNQITLLKQFGIVSAFGLFVNPVATCLLAPVYLHFFGSVKGKTSEAYSPGFMSNFFNILADTILKIINRNKRLVLTVFLGLAAFIGFFTILVNVDNDLLGYFKKNSAIRHRSQILHNNLSGTQTFFIRISSGFPGTFKQPENLKQIAQIQQYIAEKEWFDKTKSLADDISLIHREMNNGDENYYRIPDSKDLIAQYLLFLHRDKISRYVTADYSEANILVRHNISSSYELTEALQELEKTIKNTINPHFLWGLTGENILINTAADSMAAGQAKSLSLVLILIFLIMSILFVNVKAGALSLIPNLFPIVINFGIMGLFGIPLNTGTAMVAAIAIGIAVDDTIHLMSRYNTEMRVLQSQDKAVDVCIHAEVRPVISTSVALALGFAVLGFSNFVPVISFGLLSSMVMVFAIIGDLFITPILLSSTQLMTLWDMIGLQLQQAVIRNAELFRDLRPWQMKRIVLLGRVLTRETNELAVVQGEEGASMYLLLEGTAEVITRDKKTGRDIVLTTLEPGDVFGEIALVEPGPRSADVRTLEPIRYLEIDWNGLKRVQRIYPRIASRLFLNLSRILGGRLVQTDKMLFEAK
ncbi:MAG: MMPL family transporter [Deltaproteobacteria bacterium]|nr:MMPL family transporter [Deltaproteobacteria bacterium]